MKPIKLLTNLAATITVGAFLISLTAVAITNGKNELAATICTYSGMASFVSLIFVGNNKTESTAH